MSENPILAREEAQSGLGPLDLAAMAGPRGSGEKQSRQQGSDSSDGLCSCHHSPHARYLCFPDTTLSEYTLTQSAFELSPSSSPVLGRRRCHRDASWTSTGRPPGPRAFIGSSPGFWPFPRPYPLPTAVVPESTIVDWWQ
ncbi:hypothetical protein CDD83_617 [Cordyceps sp. RAO-2017]|nr:hypothetical protein CDD83_617 [Cordyceps sp. RAO-2017]